MPLMLLTAACVSCQADDQESGPRFQKQGCVSIGRAYCDRNILSISRTMFFKPKEGSRSRRNKVVLAKEL